MRIRTIQQVLKAPSIDCTYSKALANKSDAHSNGRRVPRVYLKTHDVTGSEGFLRCARHFFAGILTYFKEK